MKLLNISFLATPRAEFDFLAYRHSIDSLLFCTMHRDFEITHMKLSERGFVPGSPAQDELFFEGRNRFFHIPYRLCLYVKEQQPDVVIVHGFLFPLQVMALKLFLPAHAKLIVQHHAEQPFQNRIKLWLQRQAYGNADAYFFSSEALSAPFIEKRIIAGGHPITEILESSTAFRPQEQEAARKALGQPLHTTLFLWVGRLDQNKDPLTVLKAFADYVQAYSGAKLYMFYHEEEGLQSVQGFIEASALQHAVLLMGRAAHGQMEAWYSACDFFISGSHYESTGYALCEAMACGCIPVVTAIPAFMKISNNGAYAVLFRAGDAEDLAGKLKSLDSIDKNAFRKKITEHFRQELSFEALSGKIQASINSLLQQ